MNSSRLHPIIHGTILLTAAGFLSRILGFFYRIFLSNQIGAEGMGIYQLIFPVYGLCNAVCTASIQTAVSRYTAYEYSARSAKGARRTLVSGLYLSVFLSSVLGILVYHFAAPIAIGFLKEERCILLLQIMALSLPLGAVHSSINGYYYGMQKASVPAFSQLAEQLVRVFSVYLFVMIALEKGQSATPLLAVYGLVLGEAASVLYCLLALSLSGSIRLSNNDSPQAPSHLLQLKRILLLAVPLSANRLLLSLLQSIESVCIPTSLRSFGHTTSEALEVYGIFTGMAMPFILFPSALTNSISVMLLPAIAQAQAVNDQKQVRQVSGLAVRYSLIIGILFTGIFLFYGNEMGTLIFHNQTAGLYISILSWLCPFLYVTTTAGSILNGLEKTGLTFFHNIIALTIRILFVFFAVPKTGILGYLWGLLISQLVIAALHLYSAKRLVNFSFSAYSFILLPLIKLAASLAVTELLFRLLPCPQISELILLACRICVICLCYFLLHAGEIQSFVRPGKKHVRT